METLFPNDLLVGNKPRYFFPLLLKWTATPYYRVTHGQNISLLPNYSFISQRENICGTKAIIIWVHIHIKWDRQTNSG